MVIYKMCYQDLFSNNRPRARSLARRASAADFLAIADSRLPSTPRHRRNKAGLGRGRYRYVDRSIRDQPRLAPGHVRLLASYSAAPAGETSQILGRIWNTAQHYRRQFTKLAARRAPTTPSACSSWTSGAPAWGWAGTRRFSAETRVTEYTPRMT